MPRSDHPGADLGTVPADGDHQSQGSPPTGPPEPATRAEPPGLVESWDPTDDERAAGTRHQVQWSWHGRQSWGRRAVTIFPAVAAVLALALIVYTTTSAQGAIDQVQSVTGTGGATLLSSAPRLSTGEDSTDTGQLIDYQNVTFTQPSTAERPIENSTSLALPPYAGWEANGSAGAANGTAAAGQGLLHVGVRRATPGFRGWFLTTTGSTPASCTFQFSAASPPAVSAPSAAAIGELVMAVQTSSTVTTGDINYVVVAENVSSRGWRTLTAGYSLGHLSHATEHILKKVVWAPGPVQVAIQTNGRNHLSVWVNGALFYTASDLDLGITPPFQPYLEVQARQTPYSVAYDGYSSVCAPDVRIAGLPAGSTASLDGLQVVARNGTAVFPAAASSPPMTGSLIITSPGAGRPTRFAPHTYWPGSRFSFAPGS
jgi:hypothetical protein